MSIEKIPTCHPERWHYAKGLCHVCYQQKWKDERKVKVSKALKAESEYVSIEQENIPDLKIDGYWINQGDARKLPKLILV